MHSRTAPLLVAVLIMHSVQLQAQTTLVPEWMHTWPFGQAPQAGWYQPIGADGHVAVDPATGLIYCTASDVNGINAWQNELLYTFDVQGNDLTPAPVPGLSAVAYEPSFDETVNPHSTNDMVALNGELVASHMIYIPNTGNWTDIISFGDVNDPRRTMVPGIPAPVPQRNGPLDMNATHVVLIDVENGLQGARMHCMTIDGWPSWTASYNGLPVFDVAIHDDIAHVAMGGTIGRRSMSDGSPLPPLATNGFAQRMTFASGNIHYVGDPVSDQGTLRVARCALDGTPHWSTTVTLGNDQWLTGIVVDQAGRTWVSATAIDPMEELELGGRLICLDTDGTLLDIFSYGATMNSIATDGTHLFITGWSATNGSETYLISVGSDIATTTDAPTEGPQHPLLWPQPTAGLLNVSLPIPALGLDLMDATGRSVRHWPAHGGQRMQLDLGELPTGTYVLRAITTDGRTTHAPVIVQR